jgi:RNA polymerase sigma-70 factor (ECF subfamily)
VGPESLLLRGMPRANQDPLLATRQSLIARLSNWEEQGKWQEFFETYWRLIYSVAMRAGLRDDEAQEVVQETCIAVAKNVSRYDKRAGPFKAWLLQMTRWRITDQQRRRAKNRAQRREDDTRDTGTLDRLPGKGEAEFQGMWEEEWQNHVLDVALARLKRKVDPKHFQIFDLTAIRGWDASKAAKLLGVSSAQVYIVRHRLKKMLKEELEAVQG